jgi:hypothetical protein
MKCQHCGVDQQEDARFCDSCGRPVTKTPAAGPPPVGRIPPQGAGAPPSPWRPPPPASGAQAPYPAPMSRPPASPAPTPASPPDAASHRRLPPVPKPDKPLPPQGPAPGPDVPHEGTAIPPEVGVLSSATLILVESGASFQLEGAGPYGLGRTDAEAGIFPDVDLTANCGDDAVISRRHAELSFHDDAYWLKDLGSRNYTFVNGVRIQPDREVQLSDGDQIEFGNLRARFEIAW